MDDNFPETMNQNDSLTEKLNLLQLEKKWPSSSCVDPLEFLNKYGSRMKRLDGNEQQSDFPATCNSTDIQHSSTVATLKAAIANFKHYISQNSSDLSIFIHPFNGHVSGLSVEVNEDVELALLLLASAQKFVSQHFDRARKFLCICAEFSSSTGNPIQRVVYYFAEALKEKIDRKTGIVSYEGLEINKIRLSQLEEAVTCLQPSAFAYRQELPFFLVTQSAGIQAILESIASARKIHLVDLAIRSGSHWIILMQALAVRYECPVEMLKITAVGTKSPQMIMETGRRLSCVAGTMNIPFSFKVVMVSDMGNLTESLFELQPGEAVCVYSTLFLRNLIACPIFLENAITVLRNLCPVLMVVTETEACTDSPAFMDRFIDTLLFYGANFDSLEACMDRWDPNRISLEAEYFRWGIQNVITFEDGERSTWHMKVNAWRDFFRSHGLEDKDLSMSSLYQADLVVRNCSSGTSCTLDMDGKCLRVGWKGTPIYSLSAWNFLPLR